MGTTAQKLQNIVDTKAALSALIKDNGGTVPVEFRKYPDTLSTMIGGTGGYSLDDILELNWIKSPYVISSDTCKRVSNGALAFKGSIKELHLKTATYIGNWGCYACSNLSAVDLPSLTSIGTSCFESCNRLSVFNCPSLNSINKYAFKDTPIQHIDFPKSRGPRDYAFTDMGHLEDAKLNGLIRLYPNLFSYCYSLTAVYMNSLVNVDYNIPSYNSPFNGCLKLVEVHMPKYSGASYNINSYHQELFSSCPNTLSVYFDEKTMAEIKALHDYPFKAKAGVKFICKDGIITV